MVLIIREKMFDSMLLFILDVIDLLKVVFSLLGTLS